MQKKKYENETNEYLISSGLRKVTSPVKRKNKFNKTSSKQRIETFRDKLDDAEKNKIKADDKKRIYNNNNSNNQFISC